MTERNISSPTADMFFIDEDFHKNYQHVNHGGIYNIDIPSTMM